MANPEFSFIYNVTIRQYKNESLFNDLESDEVDVLVLANGLREATDKAEDYAEAVNQNGPYKFYDVVAVEELDTVYTGNYEEEPAVPENGNWEDQFKDPIHYQLFFVNSKTGEKIPATNSQPQSFATYEDK